MGFQAVKSPKFYPSSEQLWAEMPVDIIRTAAKEHEECMKSLDDVKAHRQINTGFGKMSKPKSQHVIPSTVSAFQRVAPNISEDQEALPVLKEKGCQEVIEMVAKFQNPSSKQQQTKVVVAQQNRQDNASTATLTSNRSQTSDSYIEHRQNRRNQVLEQFIREAKRKGQMTAAYENKL